MYIVFSLFSPALYSDIKTDLSIKQTFEQYALGFRFSVHQLFYQIFLGPISSVFRSGKFCPFDEKSFSRIFSITEW